MVGVRPGARARGVGWEAPRLGGPGLAARPAGFGPRAVDHLGRRPGAGSTANARGPLETRDGRLPRRNDHAEIQGKEMMIRWNRHHGPPWRRVDMREDGGIMAAISR